MVDKLGSNIPGRIPLVDRAVEDVQARAAKSKGAIEDAIAKGELGGVKLGDAQKAALQRFAASVDGGPPPTAADQAIVAELMLGNESLRAQLGDRGVAVFAGTMSMRDLVRVVGQEQAQTIASFLREGRTDPKPKSGLTNQIAALKAGTLPLVDVARSAVKEGAPKTTTHAPTVDDTMNLMLQAALAAVRK